MIQELLYQIASLDSILSTDRPELGCDTARTARCDNISPYSVVQYLAVGDVLVGLHEVYHATNVRSEPLLYSVYGFGTQVKPLGRTYLR